MSKSNPRKAIAAIIPAPIPIPGTDVAVRPLTLAAYAILEKIGSPLVVPFEGRVTALDLLPTLYVLTHDPMEALSADLAAASVEWADALPPTVLLPMEDAARRQIRAFLDVIPEGVKKKTASQTDGSPNSPDGPARPTAGRGAGWFLRLLRRLWGSFGGNGGAPEATKCSSSQK